jgi:molybdate transport system substrate-binding protein
MEALAASEAEVAIGCAEVPEILTTRGVQLLGVLPDTLAPGLTYAAAIPARAVERDAAQVLSALLASPDVAALKTRHGLEPRTLN